MKINLIPIKELKMEGLIKKKDSRTKEIPIFVENKYETHNKQINKPRTVSYTHITTQTKKRV